MERVPKVRRGQGITFRAKHWNSFAAAANAHAARQLAGGAEEARRPKDDAVCVSVRNDTGADRDRFDVLAINSPVFPPTEGGNEFTNRIVFGGVVPTGYLHRGRFAILQEPLASGRIGRACIAGITPARINVPPLTSAITTADMVANHTEYLQARAQGAAQVLWREDGTGVKLAVVRIGPPPQALFFAKVSTIYNGGGTYWTDVHTNGFISHVSANVCDSAGTSLDSTTYVTLKASNNADIGFADIEAGDVVAWLPTEPAAAEPVPGGMGTFDGYIVPHAGLDGAWLSLYAQKPYYEYVTGGGTPSVNTLMFNRLSILVGWYDNASVWHGIDGHPEPDPGDVTRIP